MSTARVTIAEVAAEAGVSVATVSKVINDRYGVAPATSARVRAIIAALGYHSSLGAQSLRSQRTMVLGVLVTDVVPFSAELLQGIARATRETDYELLVYSACGRHTEQVGWEQRFLARVNGTLTDGTILVTPGSVDVRQVAPVVAVDHNAASTSLPVVDADNYRGGTAATEHLLSLGHRRIGFIGGRPDLASARLRERAFRDALAAAGIEPDPDLFGVGGYLAEATDEPARRLLQLPERPTAIFAANDVSAIRTIEVARSLGLRVPDDLSVIGFDNVPESALCDPPLTTIDQSIQQLGEEAVRLLVKLIEGVSYGPTHVILPTRLVERASCRPLA